MKEAQNDLSFITVGLFVDDSHGLRIGFFDTGMISPGKKGS